MQSRKKLKIALMFLTAMGLFLASVGTAGATADGHLKMLYEGAKSEGQVIWHTSGSTRTLGPVLEAFKKQYPDIELKVVSIGSTTIASRLIAEADANKISVDVSMAFLSHIQVLKERDLLINYDWVKNMEVDPNRVLYGGTFVTHAYMPRIWIYNTKLVSKEDIPKSLEDLLDPRWKGGKISMRAAPSAFTWFWPAWKKDKASADAFLEKFAKQEILPGKRAPMVAQRVAKGECPIGTAVNVMALSLKRQGAPIGVMNLGPVASEPTVIYIPKNVPHPKAALFFMAWMISKDGQAAFAKAGIGPPAPAEAGPQAKILSDAGVEFMPIQSAEDMKAYKGEFSKTIMKIMKFMPR